MGQMWAAGRYAAWSFEGHSPISKADGSEARCGCVDLAGCVVASASTDTTARLWDARSCKCLRSLPHPSPVECVALRASKNGDDVHLVTGDAAGNAALELDPWTLRSTPLPRPNLPPTRSRPPLTLHPPPPHWHRRAPRVGRQHRRARGDAAAPTRRARLRRRLGHRDARHQVIYPPPLDLPSPVLSRSLSPGTAALGPAIGPTRVLAHPLLAPFSTPPSCIRRWQRGARRPAGPL